MHKVGGIAGGIPGLESLAEATFRGTWSILRTPSAELYEVIRWLHHPITSVERQEAVIAYRSVKTLVLGDLASVDLLARALMSYAPASDFSQAGLDRSPCDEYGWAHELSPEFEALVRSVEQLDVEVLYEAEEKGKRKAGHDHNARIKLKECVSQHHTLSEIRNSLFI